MERSGEDSSGIREQILLAWAENKTLLQIAEELNLGLKLVSEILKSEQRKIVEREGESDERGSKD